MADESFNLFVYGTLMSPATFRAVLGRRLVPNHADADGVEAFYARHAVLDGYKKVSPDNTYFYAVPDRGHRIRGYLITNLPRNCLPALMRYEGRNYVRRTLQVQTSDGTERAVVFVGNPKRKEDETFGHEFRDPLKQEILLEQKIDNAIRESEREQLYADEELNRRAFTELYGPAIRDLRRRHFEAGGISNYAIRHAIKSRPIRNWDRAREDTNAAHYARSYLRMVIRQVVFNQFEERIRRELRYELDHLPVAEHFYDRIISSLIALRIINQSCREPLDEIVCEYLEDFDFESTNLIDVVRHAINAADQLYDPQPARSQLNFIRSHMGFGYLPLGAELEFSNIGHGVVQDPNATQMHDPVYDGFLYFDDFGLDALTWRLGGHIDDHHRKTPGQPRRGFFEVALGNLSIESSISRPITPDPWVLNQLIHQTRQFYEVTPHSVHMSMQLRRQYRPDRDRLPQLHILQCLFALAGDTIRDGDGRYRVHRLSTGEIIRFDPTPNMLFSEISKRYSRHGDDAGVPGAKRDEGRYVQQFRFLRLSAKTNYEPIIMGLKGIQLSLRPGTFLTPSQWENSPRHRETFETLVAWGKAPTQLAPTEIDDFLGHVEAGLVSERRGKPAHSRAYIAWSITQLEAMLQRFNRWAIGSPHAAQPTEETP
ncbi:MAG: hypothetical protein GVY16_00295 [Planctomycetes bacterium]|jgi:gamma-glutamylcyclotransferase (GGCT)/AIG2-like uncharacterized protein YtfP|nr:gamma-glutamylcyclotransferase [Phycisphaerae bacterium]NBB94164.1 hypothetical protein [Planctomycetota bacterium]